MKSGSSINKNGNIDQLQIYFKGSCDPSKSKSLEIGGSQKIFGSLFAEDANILFGAGSGFEGHVITGGKNVLINGAAFSYSKIFYAPNADVELSGSGEIKGSLIAKSLKASGNAGIVYEPPSTLLPFFPGNSEGTDMDLIVQPGSIKEIY